MRERTGRRARRFTSVLAGWAWASACAAMFWVEPSQAAGAADKAAAEALFDEGVQLLKEGKLDDACKKLESSNRIDPGIGTLLYLGECYEKSGRTASAWATFREASSMAQAAGQADRARIGQQRADRLAPQLPKLVLEMEDVNMTIENLEVSSDGVVINRGLWGTPVPIDPGEHDIVARAPGYAPVEKKVTIPAEGGTQKLHLGALEKLPEEQQPTTTEPAQPGATAAPADAGVSDSGDGQRVLGLITAGVGVVGLGVGATFGFLAMDKSDAAKNAGCNASSCPTAESAGNNATARDFASVADIGFIAGGVLVAAGAVIYFTAPEAKQTAQLHVTPTPGGAAFTFGGTF